MSKRNADMLIVESVVANEMGSTLPKINRRQARELSRDYPEQAPLRWQSGPGEPLAQPKDQPANAWATPAPLTFHEAALRIVRSQHHLNTEL